MAVHIGSGFMPLEIDDKMISAARAQVVTGALFRDYCDAKGGL
jgi:hypothetical protein